VPENGLYVIYGLHGAYPGADVVVQAEIDLYGEIWEIPEFLYFRRMHAAAHSAMSAAETNAFFNPSKPRRWELTARRQLRARGRSVAQPVAVRRKDAPRRGRFSARA